MRARLICKTGPLAGMDFELGPEGATVGRAAGNEVVLPARPISGQHAKIGFDEGAGAFILEDLGSTNGTELDGVAVTRPERLGGLHVITFSREFDFVFRTFEGEASPAPQRAEEPPPGEGTVVDGEIPTLPPVLRDDEPTAEDLDGTRIEELPIVLPKALAEPGAKPDADSETLCALRILHPKEHRRLYLLTAGEHLVGRTQDAEIWIDGPDLSRRHSRLTVSAEGVQVEDLGSRNQTFVDGEQVTEAVAARVGSRLRFASVEGELIDAAAVERFRKGEG